MFFPGSTVRLSCRFRDLLAKTDYEPDGVTVLVKLLLDDPTQEVEESFVYGDDDEVVRDSLGHYHMDYVPAVSGTYTYRWEGSGTKPVVTEARFKVHATSFHLTP